MILRTTQCTAIEGPVVLTWWYLGLLEGSRVVLDKIRSKYGPLFGIWSRVGISGFQIRGPYYGPMAWTVGENAGQA